MKPMTKISRWLVGLWIASVWAFSMLSGPTEAFAEASVENASGGVGDSGIIAEFRPLLAGEDDAANVISTEQQFYRQVGVAVDTLVKTGAGLLHTVTCASDAVATAGTLEIRDSVTAGAGVVMQPITFVAAYFPPTTLTFDYYFANGLYLDFTTTADVTCSVSYR